MNLSKRQSLRVEGVEGTWLLLRLGANILF
jgi:hypothetical protein